MSAEPEQNPSSAAATGPATPDAAPAKEVAAERVKPVEETSKANATATDVNASADSAEKTDEKDDEDTLMPDRDLDLKAADTTTTEVTGTEVVAPENDAASSKKGGKDSRRRSSAGVPEHKSKKLNKKKSMPVLNLDAQPGDYYWARLKGYPPWPSIVCDEEMLPETLLASRPVTAMRPDGTYRADFEKGGKNEKDRTYPVMYLHTNEFSWIPNIDMTKLDFDELKDADTSKKSKQLASAYEVAKEGNDLHYFKNLLMEHEAAIQEEADLAAQREEEKKAKQEAKEAAKEAKAHAQSQKKEKRKSKADLDMDDAPADDAPKSAKSSKKRKKDPAENDIDTPKSAKTPKTNLKVNLGKTPNGDSTSKSKSKSKKAQKPATEDSPSKTKPLTATEKKEKIQKEVLFFRHRLQKGFLTTDETPKEEDMKSMAEYFDHLELHRNLETSVIRATKIHKVLKAIIKLNSIPKDEEFRFKQRSIDLLQVWQKALADDTQAASAAVAASSAKANEDATPNGAEEKQNGVEPAHKKEESEEPSKKETSSGTKDVQEKEQDNEDGGDSSGDTGKADGPKSGEDGTKKEETAEAESSP